MHLEASTINCVREFSSVRLKEGIYAYTCGWNSASTQLKDSTICVLPAYFPDPIEHYSKIRVIAGSRYYKASPNFDLTIGERYLGRFGNIGLNSICTLRDPICYAEQWRREDNHFNARMKSFLHNFEMNDVEVGISGSCLTMNDRKIRHEIDIAVYGVDASTYFDEMINFLGRRGVIQRTSRYHQRFEFSGLVYDPQFSRSEEPQDPRERVSILSTSEHCHYEGVVMDASEGLFFPAIYRMYDGLTLVCAGLGQRALLRKGQRIVAPRATAAKALIDGCVSEALIIEAHGLSIVGIEAT